MWMNNIFVKSLLNESAIWKINYGSLEQNIEVELTVWVFITI